MGLTPNPNPSPNPSPNPHQVRVMGLTPVLVVADSNVACLDGLR